jgi:predicted Zn-dependent peptidase
MIQPEIKEISKVDLLKLEKRVLSNGLDMYIINAGKQDLIKVDLLFDAGNAYSKHPVLPGAVSALMNDGTSTYSSDQIADIIDGKGAFYVGDIQKDFSQCSLYLLSRFASDLLPLYYDMITDSIFPEGEVELFKRNMKQRFMVEHGKVNVQSNQAMINAVFGEDSRYADLAKAESYDTLSRTDMLSFYEERVKHSPQYIIVSGKVDDKLATTIARQFEKIDIQKRDQIHEMPVYGNVASREEWIRIPGKNNQQVSMRIAMPTLMPDHEDYYGLSLLTTILGGYFGSRLNKVLREEKGLTYGVHAHLTKLRRASVLMIHSELNADNWEEAYRAIIEVINDLKQKVISNEELEMVRRYIKGSLLHSIDGAFAYSNYHRNTLMYHLETDRINRYIHYLDKVSSVELKNLAEQYLIENNFYKIVAGV